MPPRLSAHFQSRQPSPIRRAQILCAQRADIATLSVVNLALGNVSLPAHPALRARMATLTGPGSPFAEGVVRYTSTVGLEETRRAFLNIIASAGCETAGLEVLVTDGGSAAMELMILGVCGPRSERPLCVLDPTYSNYMDLCRRVSVPTVALLRSLGESSSYGAPDLGALERLIVAERPAALLAIPADNPTGQCLRQETLLALARLCVKHELWLVSDEAYRQLSYDGERPSSVWAITEREVPGIRGSRISIESSSKVWNACGLRVGALVTDSAELHARAVAEATANLCPNAIGQWVFGALADVPHAELSAWYDQQRAYYSELMRGLTAALRAAIPGVVVSNPEASLYSVIDLSRVVPGIDATDFVRFCAERGRVAIEGRDHTLLLAPMTGFQGGAPDAAAKSQLRLAYVEGPEVMGKVPELLRALLAQYGGIAGT